MRDDGRAGRWLKSCGDNHQSKSRPDSPVHVIGDLIRVFTEMPALRQCGSNMRPKALLEEGIVEVAPAFDRSVYQEYVITRKCTALLPLLPLVRWSSECLSEHR